MLLTKSDRRQSKTLLTIEERGSKIARNRVFDCHMSPFGGQMAIENTKTLLTIDECGSKLARNCVFDCHLSPFGRQITIENFDSNYF